MNCSHSLLHVDLLRSKNTGGISPVCPPRGDLPDPVELGFHSERSSAGPLESQVAHARKGARWSAVLRIDAGGGGARSWQGTSAHWESKLKLRFCGVMDTGRSSLSCKTLLQHGGECSWNLQIPILLSWSYGPSPVDVCFLARIKCSLLFDPDDCLKMLLLFQLLCRKICEDFRWGKY